MAFDGRSYRDPVRWVRSGLSIPSDALDAGRDHNGETLYIGRVSKSGNLIPGKVIPSGKVCTVAHEGLEEWHTIYEILTSTPNSCVSWQPAANGRLPHGAIQGGHTSSNEPLFIGRTSYEGTVTPGKVHPHHGVCYISYNGKEIPCQDFEVLICTSVMLV